MPHKVHRRYNRFLVPVRRGYVPRHFSVSSFPERDLKAFLENIRECTDIQKLTPTLVNTLIKKIEIFNSVKGEDGKKHVPITIHFRSVDIVTVPDEEEIIAAREEIRNNPTKVA